MLSQEKCLPLGESFTFNRKEYQMTKTKQIVNVEETKKVLDARTTEQILTDIMTSEFKIFKDKCLNMYKTRSEDDQEYIDCDYDMKQHIYGLKFRRNAWQMQIDKSTDRSQAHLQEVGGHHKDLKSSEIPQRKSDNEEYKCKLYRLRFQIYNERIKALIEVYQELTKKTYVAGSSDSTVQQRTRTATVNFSKPIEEDLIKKNKEVLAQAV